MFTDNCSSPLKHFTTSILAAAVSLLFFASSLSSQDYRWEASGDGNWTDPANWTVPPDWDPATDFPDEAGIFVRLFGDFATEGETGTITLNQAVTLGEFFARANTSQSNFIVTGTGSLVFDNDESAASIEFQQGSTGGRHLIEVPISVVSDTLNITGRQGTISGDITAVSGNDLTINWGGGSVVIISGDNNFNNGTIVSTSGTGFRFVDSPTAAGGANTTIQLNGGDVQFENTTNFTDVNFGNSIEVSGASSLSIARLNVNNAVFTSSVTLGDITLAANSTLSYLRPNGGAPTNAPRVRVGGGHTLSLGDNATLYLSGTQTDIVDIVDQALLQGTGTVRVEDDDTGSRVRVLAGGTVRAGTETATGILNIGSTTVQGRLEMQEDSIMSFRLNGTTAGMDHDQVRFGLGPDGNSPLVVDPDSVILELELSHFYNPSDVVFLVRNDLPIPLASDNFFKGLGHGDTVTFTEGPLAGSTALISYQADFDTSSTTGGLDIALYDFAVIPEPATVGMILGTAVLLGAVWIRRRRVS